MRATRGWPRVALRCFSAIVAALVACAPRLALANGRFPRAHRLIEDPRDPNHLFLAATYGIVTTADRGRNWYHICEASFTLLEQYVGDPILELAADGALLVDIQSALNVSVDRGCSWSAAFGGPGHYVPDFTIAQSQKRNILALYAVNEGTSVVNRLIASIDDGKSFHPIGGPVPVGVAFTIDVAASDPDLVYVSGLSRTNSAVLAVSADHGSSWTTKDIALGPNEMPYIAAVDPRDGQKVFLRVSSITDENGVPASNDALFVTADGGATWREVFRAGAQALGFALSPDGRTVLIGYGDPKGDVAVDSSALGIYRSDANHFDFSRLSTTSTSCLAWTASGIYVCTTHLETGHALAFAPGASLSPDASGLEPLLDLRDVRGPLVCCGGRANGRCAASWPVTCSIFGACSDASSVGTDSCDSGAPIPPWDASFVDAPTPSDEDAAGASTKRVSDGCGCRMTVTRPFASGACFVAFVVAIAAFARRRQVTSVSSAASSDRSSP